MLPLPAEGFASGSLDEDAYAPRSFIDKGLEVMVSQSYSKNLGRASSLMLDRGAAQPAWLGQEAPALQPFGKVFVAFT